MEKTITFFSDFFDSIEFLPDELFGAAIRAAMKYQLTGEEYSGDNPSVKMAFNFAKGQTDRKREYSRQKSYAAKSRWERNEETPLQNNNDSGINDEAQCEDMQNDTQGCKDKQREAEPCKEIQEDAPYPSPYPSPYPNPDIKSEAPAKEKKPPKKSFGQYGWVKLSDEEYAAIVTSLGRDEAERCISYVDECAQGTGNKNKWRDWNLVVRKCSRDGWGKHLQGSYQRKERPGDIHGCTGLGQAELEAIAMTLKQPPDDIGMEASAAV